MRKSKELSTKKIPLLKQIKDNQFSYLFALPYMTFFFIFTVLPVITSVILSFTDFNMLQTPSFVGINNYSRLFFNDNIFIKAVKNTLVLAVLIGPGGYLLSLIFAWFINELTPKIRAFVTLIFYAPSICGNGLLIWQTMFSSDEYGYMNSLLIRLGLIQEPILWFQNPKYMLLIVVLISLWSALGTGFLSFIAGFQGMDKSCYEAGAIDGIRNRFQELWFITLPMMKPQMMFSAVMSITGAFNVGAVITALCGYPSNNYELHTIMNHLEDYGGMRYEMGYASSIAVVLFAMMIGANELIKRLIGKVGQ